MEVLSFEPFRAIWDGTNLWRHHGTYLRLRLLFLSWTVWHIIRSLTQCMQTDRIFTSNQTNHGRQSMWPLPRTHSMAIFKATGPTPLVNVVETLKVAAFRKGLSVTVLALLISVLTTVRHTAHMLRNIDQGKWKQLQVEQCGGYSQLIQCKNQVKSCIHRMFQLRKYPSSSNTT